MSKVVIGLSGGVDSSVAAWLLKQAGHEVVALFMINWHDTAGTLSGDCPWEDDRMFAELVARKLDLPFHVVDLSEGYRARVVDYMFAEYGRGRTPNPDVLCNREVKFDLFLQEALGLGADYVATGHYARVEKTAHGTRHTAHAAENSEVFRLLAGVDGNKDQSYFLCQLSQAQLRRTLFPIGGMTKPEVRRIAQEQGLATARRKDSQGICFVGKVDLPVFLQQQLAAQPGDIVEIPASWEGYAAPRDPFTPYIYAPADGVKVGEHGGAHCYTIGQRKGLGVGGKAEPLFVIATDVARRVVYVGQGEAHPGLYRNGLIISADQLHWVRPDRALAAGEEGEYRCRIRYRQPLQRAKLTMLDDGSARLLFDAPQRGITAGQFAAWYDLAGEELLGSGVIE